MEDYQKTYLEKMGPRIEALLSSANGLADDFVESAASLRRMAHALRGSGGTYGFPEITEAAAAVEDAPDTELDSRASSLIDLLQALYTPNRPDRERLLVVDDSEEIRLMLSVILEAQGYHVTTAETAEAGRACLESHSFDLLILDLVLPDMDGRNFLIKLRESPATSVMPVIVLSAKNSPQIKAECFALGADEYFEKPLDPALLTTRVAVGLQKSRQMKQQYRLDTLTGLPNRAAFTEAYLKAQTLSGEVSSAMCIAMLDVDHFKKVNDEHGHIVADAVLKNAAIVMTRPLRKTDVLARWGGEEFSVLLPETELSSAKQILNQLLQALQDKPYVQPGGQAIAMSISGGVIQIEGRKDLNEALAKADLQLYRAKSAGRNCIFGPDDVAVSKIKKILMAEDDDLTAEFVQHRLKRDGFELDHFVRGDLALEAAQSKKYDLAIFDVKMPGMEGFELLQRTRKDSLNQETPVIMLTSMGSEQDISRGLALGANDYVLKPFSPMELMARIRRLLK